MDSTRYIGRVGALAVAMGIGTALSAGTGAAWAEDGSANAGGSNNAGPDPGGSTSAPANKADSTADDATAPRHKGPLSALNDRIRKKVDTGLDDAADAMKRAQSDLAKSRTRLETNRAEVQRKIEDAAARLRVTGNAGTDSAATDSAEVSADRPGTAERARTSRIIPEAVGVVPNLRKPERTDTVVVEITRASQRASQDLAQHAVEAISTVVPSQSKLSGAANPVAEAVSASTSPELINSPVGSALMLAAGFSTLLGNGPAAPGQSPALWTLAAWARREFERTVETTGNGLQSAKDAESTAAPNFQPTALVAADDEYDPNPGLADAPVITGNANTTQVGWTTGPNTNTGHWYIRGTDLGIMWDSGYTDAQGNPVIFTVFGDTYSEPDFGGDWRNNVLLRSSDLNLNNGLQFSDALIHAGANPTNPGTPEWYGTSGAAAGAAQIIDDPGFNGLFGSTHTMIPTAAIAVDNGDGTYTQYATVMSVRTWDRAGSWTTNYSAIAVSTDGGQTWEVQEDTVRSSGWWRSSTRYVPGDERFQQNALVYGDPDDPDSWTSADPETREQYIYVYGTPSGRQGAAYVARVPESELTNLDAYQYWAGENSDGTGNWVTADPSAAVPVISASRSNFLPHLYRVLDCFTFGLFTTVANGIWVGGLPTGGYVSEMSVQYNEHLDRYVVTYTDRANNVVLRVSETPQGTWSNPTTLLSVVGNSGAYAPMIHPLSGTSALGAGNEQYLYFNLSQWDDYNVRMMRANLDNLTIT